MNPKDIVGISAVQQLLSGNVNDEALWNRVEGLHALSQSPLQQQQPSTWDYVRGAAGAIYDEFATKPPELASFWQTMLIPGFAAAGGGISHVFGQHPGAGKAMWDAAKQAPGALLRTGWHGAQAVGTGAWNALKGFGSGAWSAAQHLNTPVTWQHIKQLASSVRPALAHGAHAVGSAASRVGSALPGAASTLASGARAFAVGAAQHAANPLKWGMPYEWGVDALMNIPYAIEAWKDPSKAYQALMESAEGPGSIMSHDRTTLGRMWSAFSQPVTTLRQMGGHYAKTKEIQQQTEHLQQQGAAQVHQQYIKMLQQNAEREAWNAGVRDPREIERRKSEAVRQGTQGLQFGGSGEEAARMQDEIVRRMNALQQRQQQQQRQQPPTQPAKPATSAPPAPSSPTSTTKPPPPGPPKPPEPPVQPAPPKTASCVIPYQRLKAALLEQQDRRVENHAAADAEPVPCLVPYHMVKKASQQFVKYANDLLVSNIGQHPNVLLELLLRYAPHVPGVSGHRASRLNRVRSEMDALIQQAEEYVRQKYGNDPAFVDQLQKVRQGFPHGGDRIGDAGNDLLLMEQYKNDPHLLSLVIRNALQSGRGAAEYEALKGLQRLSEELRSRIDARTASDLDRYRRIAQARSDFDDALRSVEDFEWQQHAAPYRPDPFPITPSAIERERTVDHAFGELFRRERQRLRQADERWKDYDAFRRQRGDFLLNYDPLAPSPSEVAESSKAHLEQLLAQQEPFHVWSNPDRTAWIDKSLRRLRHQDLDAYLRARSGETSVFDPSYAYLPDDLVSAVVVPRSRPGQPSGQIPRMNVVGSARSIPRDAAVLSLRPHEFAGQRVEFDRSLAAHRDSPGYIDASSGRPRTDLFGISTGKPRKPYTEAELARIIFGQPLHPDAVATQAAQQRPTGQSVPQQSPVPHQSRMQQFEHMMRDSEQRLADLKRQEQERTQQHLKGLDAFRAPQMKMPALGSPTWQRDMDQAEREARQAVDALRSHIAHMQQQGAPYEALRAAQRRLYDMQTQIADTYRAHAANSQSELDYWKHRTSYDVQKQYEAYVDTVRQQQPRASPLSFDRWYQQTYRAAPQQHAQSAAPSDAPVRYGAKQPPEMTVGHLGAHQYRMQPGASSNAPIGYGAKAPPSTVVGSPALQ